MTDNPQADPRRVTLARRSDLRLGRKIRNLLWRWVNTWVFPLTLRSHGARRVLLRVFGAQVGAGVRLSPRCRIEHPENLSIGGNSSIGAGCYIQALDRIAIGRNTCISDEVAILTGSHDLASPVFALLTRPVVLGDEVWLAYRATILPGVTLGRGAVAGAGAVVRESFGAMAILSGNPARKVADREIGAVRR
jgi:putative colanic acid biosynthesis acetyltransferase WcaF